MVFTNKYFNLILCCLIISFPVLVLSLKHASGVIFLLLAIIGICFYPWLRKDSPLKTPEILLITALLLFVFTAGIAILFGDDVTTGYRWFGKFLRFALAVPIFLLLRRISFSDSMFWYSLAIGASLNGIIALVEIYIGHMFDWGGGHTGRASGITHPIMFGDIALAMGAMAFCGLGYFRQQHSWMIAIPILALILGMTASFLSGSRGAWIALPALFMALLWSMRSVISGKISAIVVSALIGFSIIIYVMPGANVATRLNSTLNQYDKYLDAPLAYNLTGNPVGIRLEMWQASWVIFKNSPVLGVGWGNYNSAAQQLVDKGERNSAITKYRHPHNQYLSSMANSGITGLISTLFLLALPAYIFYKAYKHGSIAQSTLGMAGIVLIIVFAHFALTEGVFERNITINFYGFYLVLITALIHRPEKKS